MGELARVHSTLHCTPYMIHCAMHVSRMVLGGKCFHLYAVLHGFLGVPLDAPLLWNLGAWKQTEFKYIKPITVHDPDMAKLDFQFKEPAHIVREIEAGEDGGRAFEVQWKHYDPMYNGSLIEEELKDTNLVEVYDMKSKDRFHNLPKFGECAIPTIAKFNSSKLKAQSSKWATQLLVLDTCVC